MISDTDIQDVVVEIMKIAVRKGEEWGIFLCQELRVYTKATLTIALPKLKSITHFLNAYITSCYQRVYVNVKVVENLEIKMK